MSKAWPVRDLKPKKSVRRNAERIMRVRIDEFYSYAPIIPDPANVTELHNARIAAKRLRYTLDLFAFVFGDAGKLATSELKQWQELLGQIHDNDVRIELIESTRERANDQASDVRDGLTALLERERASRVQMHHAVVRKWVELDAAGFEEHLRNLT
jgi:CHAD domain-containing protein